MAIRNKKNSYNSLGIILLLLALNAFGGGYYGMAGASGVPVEWLDGSPFKTYFLPSLFLFVVIGGISLFAAIELFLRNPIGQRAAYYTGFILLAWIAVQVFIIGHVSWMQPATFMFGIIILIMASKLPTQNAY